MKKANVGDIVLLKENGIRRIIVDERDEIVQYDADLKLRVGYKVAGPEFQDRWFYNTEIENISPKKQ